MQLKKRDMLYIINKAIKFGIARLICKGINLATTKAMFNTFKLTWINTYFDLPDFVIYNHKTNFNFKKFRTLFRFVGSIPKLVLVKAHHLISKVERYHRLLRHAYEIVTKKHLELSNANRLQIVIKAINNIVEPNELIPTLLVLGAYLKMTELDPSNLIVK